MLHGLEPMVYYCWAAESGSSLLVNPSPATAVLEKETEDVFHLPCSGHFLPPEEKIEKKRSVGSFHP